MLEIPSTETTIEEFLESLTWLKAGGWEAFYLNSDKIRLRPQGGHDDCMCPIAAVIFMQQKERIPDSRAYKSAYLIGLSPYSAEQILQAADSRNDCDPKLRARIIDIFNLK